MNQATDPEALPAGTRLHWYSVERVLGQGGFAITYLARDTNLDQRVAIKEYFPIEVAQRAGGPGPAVRPRSQEQRGRFDWGIDRFLSEARILAQFDHPNIVRVLSIFEENGTAYMVMRFETGTDLGTLLQQRRTLPEREILEFLLPVLDGLELVHNANFIHRDIKPENLYIRTDRSPVLLDFGSARQSLGEPRTVTVLVAQGYTPFEQYYGEPETLGPWTDIYSLGATCYRAISGMTPVDAISRAKGVLGSPQDSLIPARTIGQGRYSEAFLAAIDHAMSFSEGKRPQSISEWRQEILAATAPAVAPPDTVRIALPAAPAATPTPAGPASEPRRAAGMAPALWAVIGGGVVAATFVALMLSGVMPGSGGRDPAPGPAPGPTMNPGAADPSAQPTTVTLGPAPQPAKADPRDPRHANAPVTAPVKAPVPVPAPAPAPAPAPTLVPAPAPVSAAASKPKVETPAPSSAHPATEAIPAAGEPAPVAAMVASTPPARPPAPAIAATPLDDASLALHGDVNAMMREGNRLAHGLTANGREEHLQAYIYFRLAQVSGRADAEARASEERKLLQPPEIRQAERHIEGLRARIARAGADKEVKP